MSILIQDMEMPKNCNECLVNCGRSMLYIGITDRRSPNCPLVEIPTPHGRLIDADELVRIWKGAMFSGDIKPIVDARSTVIEAEGREE